MEEKILTLTLDGTDYTVQVHGNTFIVNGHPFVVGFQDDGSVTVDGIAYDIALDGDNAIVAGIAHSVQLTGLDVSPVAPGPAQPAASTAGASAIRAIMPGSIVRVLVDQGAQVAAGDVLLVLEAMKMENELKAPISGVVTSIHVQSGQTVEMNALLAEIEALDASA
jgi:biotin carboxyl carrier protein